LSAAFTAFDLAVVLVIVQGFIAFLDARVLEQPLLQLLSCSRARGVFGDRPGVLALLRLSSWDLLPAVDSLAHERKRPRSFLNVAFIYAGNYLLSHTLSRAVPSAQRGLTSVFGMGTGGTPAVRSPTT
jgi:hypothetical protein